MYRKLTASVILFFIVSLLVGLPFALAQSETENNQTTLESAKDDVTNAHLEDERIETQFSPNALIHFRLLLRFVRGNSNS